MKSLHEKRKLIIAAIAVLMVIGTFPLAYFMFKPEFPESVPSSDNLDSEAGNYLQQTALFNKFTRYLRLNHGGIIEADKTEPHPEKTTDDGNELQYYKHRYRLINDKLIIKLIRNFGKSEQIPYKIKKYTYKNKTLNKPDSYEVIFYQRDTPWISIKMEWADEGLFQKRQQIQYTEVTDQSRIDQVEPEPTASPRDHAKLVIVIDDLGNNMKVFRNFLQLDYEITYAVLPQMPFSSDTAELVNKAGHDVMLHLPMQPKEWPKYNPGTGALFLTDSEEVIQQKMERNFQSVPYIVGVNNHMGSAYTQYSEGLDILMKILGRKNLFFMDSKTAPGNISKNRARDNNVRYMSRNIFLDNLQEKAYVTGQLHKAARIARKNGRAIAIGHPYQITYQVLAEQLPLLEKDGIEVTRVSALLNH